MPHTRDIVSTSVAILTRVILNRNALSHSESMVSLSFRSLATFIAEDNFYGLQGFLENRRVQVDDRDENGTTALMVAAAKGKFNFVRELLEHGADVNLEDFDNWTPFISAAKEGYKEICAELLDHGANINHRDMGSWTALMWAAYKGRVETARLLMERGADVNAHDNFHVSPLQWAAGRGHVDICRDLLQHGARVNMGDKYGTTALVWAARRGYTEIVDSLLKAGANVDACGMYSWTPLLVSTKGNSVDIVNMLLEHRPNVNALDKDGCTALMIACKEGCHEIAVSLLNSGAYVNLQDRGGDTNLIHAAKAGHRAVVEALLKKYADLDVQGKDKKTALYWSVEKGNVGTVKQLLSSNPDVELATKDGDTPLMRAVRTRNVEVVQLLLDKKAKVTATDKNGDTALHIAMRARSKGIVEVLLRNPKNSQLLYRPNRAGETPYNIDISYQKPILGQIFGARRLNTNEDNENMLGYDLYSSALADILSEPSLSMPITVGLYAKWGSGKSFLLSKLRDEMKSFARRWVDPSFRFSLLLLTVVLHFALILGVILGLAFQSSIVGVAIGVGTVIVIYFFLFVIWYGSRRYDWYWTYSVGIYLARQLKGMRLLLQVMFCHPPGAKWGDEMQAQPISFYFTDQTKVNNAAGCENAVVQMIGSLYDAIENDYGMMVTRLYRAFRPKPVKSTSSWKWRRLCCLPYFVIFIFCFLCLLMGIAMLTIYFNRDNQEFSIDLMSLQAILISTMLIVGVVVIANLYTLGQVVQSLLFSHRRHLQRAMSKLDTVKAEGYLQSLKGEVNLMIDMVKCLDAFAQQQTRLVVIVDGLDSCEQDKVLHVLDAVHNLFSDPKAPFIIVWNIDPHKIAKAIEQNLHKMFTDSNIGAHDYLRNMVHLPFYLQNSGLRKAKVAQQTALTFRKSMTTWTDAEESVTNITAGPLSGLSPRRSSVESNFGASERPSLLSKKGKKLKISESLASSLGSNLNRAGGAHDLTKMLLTDDYFSDVNPRSMRRLMNVLYITGRLLKAFHIDFNWYRLASWVNITEQWPYRTSWIILYFETYEDSLEDTMSLKAVYDKIRPQIPVLKEIEPLVEMDRDERKFDILLSFHKSTLLVADLKIFLPFTINLDPYIRKTIKEEQQNMEEMGIVMTAPTSISIPPAHHPHGWGGSTTSPGAATAMWEQKANLIRRQVLNKSPHHPHHPQTSVMKQPVANALFSPTGAGGVLYPAGPSVVMWPPAYAGGVSPYEETVMAPLRRGRFGAGTTSLMLSPDVLEKRLAMLSVEGICDVITRLEGINPVMVEKYCSALRENNVSGRVLLYCELDELKKVLQMNFGDWELFKLLVMTLRDQEIAYLSGSEEVCVKNVRFATPSASEHAGSGTESKRVDAEPKVRAKSIREKSAHPDGPSRRASRQNVLEKQVTLEEQMIIGALQTLNEEAFEDTRKKDSNEEDGADAAGSSISTLSPIQSDPEELDSDSPVIEIRSRDAMDGELGVVYLHTSPMHESTVRSQPGSQTAPSVPPAEPVEQRLTHSGSLKLDSIRRDRARVHQSSRVRDRSRSPRRPSSLHVAEEGSAGNVSLPSSPTPLLDPKTRSISLCEDHTPGATSPGQARKSLLRSLDIGASFEKLHRIKQQLITAVTSSESKVDVGGSDDSNDDGDETPLVSVSSSPVKPPTGTGSVYTTPLSPTCTKESEGSSRSPEAAPLMRQEAVDSSREATPVRSTGEVAVVINNGKDDPETTV